MSSSTGAEEQMVMAKYDYKARDKQELNISKNEKLILLDDSKHWWMVKNFKEETGFVPSNYVKRIKPSILESLKNIGKGTLGRKKSVDRLQIQQLAQNFAENGAHHSSGPGEAPDVHIGSTVTAKYSYIAQQPDELSFSKGDKVIVIEQSNDGWWKGTKDSEKGWFPSNYVEALAEQLYSQAAYMTDEPSAEPLDIVLTLYPFKSENPEELNFVKDERLEIIGKPSEDPDWWKARNDRGKIGLVPINYVQVLTEHTACSEDYLDRDEDTEGRLKYAKGSNYESKEWFYGKITRSEAESWLSRLADHGDYLIRQSETNIGDFTVSVKASTKNRHFLVSSSNNETVFKIGQQTFSSLDELVEHYTRHPIFRSDSEKLYLVKPFRL
ncbi:cytoplasmic protein NCK2-like isoform X2 [Watersipora subatra]